MSYSKSAKNILERARNLQTGKIKILSIGIKAKNILYSARKIFGDRPKNILKGEFQTKTVYININWGCPGLVHTDSGDLWGQGLGFVFLMISLIYSTVQPGPDPLSLGFWFFLCI